MSKRTWTSECLVLSLRNFGEANRSATLLLPENENGCQIVQATLYGGPKISDFKVKEFRSSIRDNLTRIWCASLASELAVKLEGNIDWNLINYFLTGISRSDENQCRLALMRFLWRVIIFSGLAPELNSCAYCDEGIRLNNDLNNSSRAGKSYFYLPTENAAVLCSACTQKNESGFKLSEEACLYLYATQYLEPKISRDMPISEGSYSELKQFLFYLIQNTVNKVKAISFLFNSKHRQ